MKLTKQQLKEIIREEIQRLNEASGIYLSDFSLNVIILSLEKSKMINSSVIEELKRKNGRIVDKNISKYASTIIKSLESNGNVWLNSRALNSLIENLNKLVSKEATFVDYIEN